MSAAVWDVIIVGSGPAGSAAAIGALASRPSASVLLLDRADFPRDKACGDGVLDAALAELERFGVARERIVNGYRSVDTMRITSPRGVQVCGKTSCPITIVPRVVLDANLRAAAQDAGAQWTRHTVRSVRERDTHAEIDEKFKARIVIAADGAESAVRRSLIASQRRDIAVAIRGYARATDDRVPTIMLEDRPGLAYAWSFPTTGGPTNVGYGESLLPGEATSRSALLRKMHALLPGLEVDPATIRAHRLPLSTSDALLTRGRFLFVGDAASLINPISGEGINYAIATGLAAGAASMLGPAHAGADYRARVHRRFGRHHRDVATLAALTRSRTLLEAGARAARKNHGVFEDIATLGIGEGWLTGRLMAGMATEVLLGAARSLLPAALVHEPG